MTTKGRAFQNWLRMFTNARERYSRRFRYARRWRTLESLEDRSLLAVFMVDTPLDVVDAGDGATSLREAIISANTTAGDDTIMLPAGTYTLAIAGVDEDASATGDLDITDSVTITGAGAATTTIDAAGIDRVLHLHAMSGPVSMSGLTITGGQTALTLDDRGGGVFNHTTLTLGDVVVTDNEAGRGGGIFHSSAQAASLTATSILVSGNSADEGGGVFNNSGSLTIVDSTISGNTATVHGGGAMNIGSLMTLTGSTVSGNVAGSGGGGGIFNNAPLEAANSTVSGNMADGHGGGISNTGAGATADLFHITVSNNTADNDADGSGNGGGIFDSTDAVFLGNSIVANNVDTGGQGPDFFGLVNTNGFNLVEDATGTSFTAPVDITGQDPLLGPLADNGGPTQTHALLAGSLAIDAADPNDFANTDQRGVGRPVDGDGNGSLLPDMGAFEASLVVVFQADLAVSKSDSPDPVEPGQQITYTVTITNNGPDEAEDVVLSDMVPANTSFVSLTAPAGWTTMTPPVGGTGAVTAEAGSIDDGATSVFTLVVLVNNNAPDDSMIANTAVVTSETSDPAGGNNSVTVSTLVEVPAQSVLDVHLFYNNSVHDGNGAAVAAADFAAIDPTKEPLLSASTATFANVSGYAKGINGVFIDVPALPNDGAGITAADVMVTVGNDNSPGDWADGPMPQAAGVLPNAAPGGADRIFLTFADNAIVDQWVRFRIRANVNTGLLVAEDFFFGSVPGDTGAAFVGIGEFFGRDAADLQSMVQPDVLFHPAAVDNPNDVNRDGIVNAFDFQIVPVFSFASIGGAFHSNVISAITPQIGPLGLAAATPAAVDEAVEQAAGLLEPWREFGGSPVDIPADQRVGESGIATSRDLALATFGRPVQNDALPAEDLCVTLATGRLGL